jgi:transposase
MPFVRARISLFKIKKIIKHFCVDITATNTALLTGINRNTVNRYYSLFRELICEYQIQEFKKEIGGEVEFDESYFGAKRIRGFHGKLKRGRGTLKQPVFGLFKRNGRVLTEIVPDCKKKTLQALILGHVSKESIIYTDGWRGYDGLVDVGYDKHFRVNHGANEFSLGNGVHINGIESFWSFTKRRLNKFNGVKKYFAYHLKESEWRWNKSSREMEKDLLKLYTEYINRLE